MGRDRRRPSIPTKATAKGGKGVGSPVACKQRGCDWSVPRYVGAVSHRVADADMPPVLQQAMGRLEVACETHPLMRDRAEAVLQDGVVHFFRQLEAALGVAPALLRISRHFAFLTRTHAFSMRRSRKCSTPSRSERTSTASADGIRFSIDGWRFARGRAGP